MRRLRFSLHLHLPIQVQVQVLPAVLPKVLRIALPQGMAVRLLGGKYPKHSSHPAAAAVQEGVSRRRPTEIPAALSSLLPATMGEAAAIQASPGTREAIIPAESISPPVLRRELRLRRVLRVRRLIIAMLRRDMLW